MAASEQLVADYLDRLYASGRALTRTQIEELMVDVREHVAAAIAEAGRDDEATVRTVLDRLGDPEEIVAAAGGAPLMRSPATTSPAAASGNWSWRELTAVVLLAPGALLAPVLAPLAGMAFAWSSEVWDKQAKRVAYWIGAVGVALPLVLGAIGIGLFLPFRSEVHSTITEVQTQVDGAARSGQSAPIASVPSVEGMTADEAEMSLLSSGLTVSKRYVNSDRVPVGDVIGIEPRAGTALPTGGNVRLSISIG